MCSCRYQICFLFCTFYYLLAALQCDLCVIHVAEITNSSDGKQAERRNLALFNCTKKSVSFISCFFTGWPSLYIYSL